MHGTSHRNPPGYHQGIVMQNILKQLNQLQKDSSSEVSPQTSTGKSEPEHQ